MYSTLSFNNKKSKRYIDPNGFLCVKQNPLAKAGVFEYTGKSLGISGVEQDKIYKVFRPFDELVKSIKGLEGAPIVLHHHWVDGTHRNPEIMGTIAGEVTAKEPYLYGDIKIINDEARRAIETRAAYEISPGYQCSFTYAPGEYEGEAYDFVAYNIRYNHVALVDVGRSGHDLRILDSKEDGVGEAPEEIKETEEKKESVMTKKLKDEAVEVIKDDDAKVITDSDLVEKEDEKKEEVVTEEDVIIEDDDELEEEENEDEAIEDEDDVIEEEKKDVKVADDEDDKTCKKIDNVKVQDAVDEALRKYKKEHARALKAVADVKRVTGKSVKIYDDNGDIFNAKKVYILGCERLGMSELVKAGYDPQSLFVGAKFMIDKVKRNTDNNSVENVRVMDAKHSDDTIESLFKNVLRRG